MNTRSFRSWTLPYLAAGLALFAALPAMADPLLAPLDCAREPASRSVNANRQTFVTHPWVITNSNTEHGAGHCLALFQPVATAGIAVIQ